METDRKTDEVEEGVGWERLDGERIQDHKQEEETRRMTKESFKRKGIILGCSAKPKTFI